MLGAGAGAACFSSPAKAELATETHRSRSTEVVSSDVLLVVSVGGGTPSNEEPRPSN